MLVEIDESRAFQIMVALDHYLGINTKETRDLWRDATQCKFEQYFRNGAWQISELNKVYLQPADCYYPEGI